MDAPTRTANLLDRVLASELGNRLASELCDGYSDLECDHTGHATVRRLLREGGGRGLLRNGGYESFGEFEAHQVLYWFAERGAHCDCTILRLVRLAEHRSLIALLRGASVGPEDLVARVGDVDAKGVVS